MAAQGLQDAPGEYGNIHQRQSDHGAQSGGGRGRGAGRGRPVMVKISITPASFCIVLPFSNSGSSIQPLAYGHFSEMVVSQARCW